MPIITSGPSKRRLATTENLIFSRGQSAKAAFNTALESNPVALIDETLTLDKLEQPRLVPQGTRFARRRDPDARVISPPMSEDQAKERANKEGFQWKTGATTEDAFEFIAQRRKRQQKRAAIMDGAPQDLVQMGTNFTAMLAASIVDPINVASGFIPVVGATRWAVASQKALQGAKLGTLAESVTAIPMMARFEKFGRMTKGNRLAFAGKVGFTEGAVGATVVEPLVYTLSNQLQDDYTFADSALNILIGSVLGSALHMGGTALTGRLPGLEARPNLFKTRLLDRDTPAKVREATAKTAVVQLTEGRLVDVEDILISEREISLAERLSTAQGIEREVINTRIAELEAQKAPRQEIDALRTGKISAEVRQEIDQRINAIEIPSVAETNQRVIDRFKSMKSRADSPSLSTESKATMDDVNTVDVAPETVETRTQSSADERTALQEDAEAAGVEWETPDIKAAEQAETDLNVSIQRAADYIACRRVHG